MTSTDQDDDLEITDQPSFKIGDLEIRGDLILAPMDGISDQPFRLLARRLGSAMTYSEFINAIDLVFKHPHLEQHLQFCEEERPFFYQIFDEDPDRILKAALKLRRRNPDGIDINMGCSARSVSGRGAGAGLLCAPIKISQIISSLTKNLDIPITAKIRLGWEQKNLNHVEIAKIIEDSGGKMIAVHGRTRDQSFQHSANWDAIAEVKQAVKIPIIGNGDIKSVEDIRLMKQITGCDAVMIGRAAISNPWIFSGQNRNQVQLITFRKTVEEHLGNMLEFYKAPRAIILFRKYIKKYLQPYSEIPGQFESLMTETDPARFQKLIDDIFIFLGNQAEEGRST